MIRGRRSSLRSRAGRHSSGSFTAPGPRSAVVAAVFALALACNGARAEVNAYVLMPNVTQGEHEFDFRFGSASRGDAVKAADVMALGWGYGVTGNWFTELSVQSAREAGRAMRFDSVEWENVLQMSEPGQWPVDVGVVAEVEKTRDPSEGWIVRFGPLLQRDFGRIQSNLNVLARHPFGSAVQGATRFEYQFQTKYRYREALEWGVQGFGDLGASKSPSGVSRQRHQVGPALFGALGLGRSRSLIYNVGYLIGTTDASHDRTLRAQIEFEY